LPIADYIEEKIPTVDEPMPFGWNDPQIRKIITVGRFFPEKGISFVTQIAIETMQRFPDVIWWIVGGKGPTYAFCEEMINRSHLENRILLLGQRNDVPALLKQSYLQVVGSVFEGLPLNVLESSILGVPTVGPNIKGLDEAIQNDRTGYLIETRIVENFVSAVSTLLENPDLRNQMGKNAKNYVIEKHNSSYWIEQLMNYYERDYSQKVNRATKLNLVEKN
jgi:glycosyltransferase involved in cell wall biosynthesis